jgi:CPA2 family monovalent cation:H+ antiporter-2
VHRPVDPAFVTDREIAEQLAEIGVILLMFGVGLHFSTVDLMAVRRIAVPGPIGQIIIATAVGTSMAALWRFSCRAWTARSKAQRDRSSRRKPTY